MIARSLILGLMVVSSAACGADADADARPPALQFAEYTIDEAGQDTGSDGAGGASSGTCDDGETRRCTVQLPSHGEVENCFSGIQVCEAGSWGPCGDDEETELSEGETSDASIDALTWEDVLGPSLAEAPAAEIPAEAVY